jgi:2-dehydro-3-deoxyphosphogluconate aldolase / (4S)-4-hydroxy-2-oxoglutarate aldolase
MDKKEIVLDLIKSQGIVPLYFHPEATVCAEILRALYRAGARVVEFTNRGPAALQNFLQLRKIAGLELPGLYLGAGTIKNKIEATEFINEGADFIVSPGIVKAVGDLAVSNDLLWIPGCLTPTEILLADDLGAGMVKLFPASLHGPGYLAAIKEIFPDILFMPTGGIDTNEENLRAWFASGAAAVGLGSKLLGKTSVDGGDYAAIATLTRQTLDLVQKIRK